MYAFNLAAIAMIVFWPSLGADDLVVPFPNRAFRPYFNEKESFLPLTSSSLKSHRPEKIIKAKSVASLPSLETSANLDQKKRSSMTYAPTENTPLPSIQERQHSNDALEIALVEVEKLKKKLEMKSLFVRSVSHEIRTPLNIVFAALLWLELEANQMDAEFQETIAMTKDACTAAVDILNDMLAYEKIDGNILTLEMGSITLLQLVNEVVKPFYVQAKQKSIHLEVKALGVTEIVKILGDEHKLQQVVRNLISNALKFTLPGGNVKVHLTLFGVMAGSEKIATDVREWVRIEVIDDGYGIAEVFAPRSEFSKFNYE